MAKETYEMSDCSKAVFREMWEDPSSEQHKKRGWLRLMRHIQAELIRCHFESMDGKTRLRARETLSWLEAQG